MRKPWQWPWALWLRLLPCQLVAWLMMTAVAYKKHCADITLPGLMENINNVVVIWNALRPENKHRGSSVNSISCGRFFFSFFPPFQCCLSPDSLSNVRSQLRKGGCAQGDCCHSGRQCHFTGQRLETKTSQVCHHGHDAMSVELPLTIRSSKAEAGRDKKESLWGTPSKRH